MDKDYENFVARMGSFEMDMDEINHSSIGGEKMTQFIKITDDDAELMHYGTLGMKWGRHRAVKSAEKAARSRATAKDAREESRKVASGFHGRANILNKASADQARSGHNLKSMATKTYAQANRERAKEVEKEGKDLAGYYDRVSKRKTEKAKKLVEKYGDEATKKKVESLLKSNNAKSYGVFFDDTDPIVAGVRDAWESASMRARYDRLSENR
jgi:hypothetical protein